MKSSCLVGFSIEVGSSRPLRPPAPPHTHTPHSRGTGSAEHTHTHTHSNNAEQRHWLADHALLANSRDDTVFVPQRA